MSPFFGTRPALKMTSLTMRAPIAALMLANNSLRKPQFWTNTQMRIKDLLWNSSLACEPASYTVSNFVNEQLLICA